MPKISAAGVSNYPEQDADDGAPTITAGGFEPEPAPVKSASARRRA